jgi:hypothetical protein
MGDGRAQAAAVGDEEREPDTLAYIPEQPTQRLSIPITSVVFLPVVAFALVSWLSDSVGLGVLAGCASLGVHHWRRKRARAKPHALLRVEGQRLHLSGPAFVEPLTVPLDDLLDVYLDTKTIQRLRESPGPMPELRFINATVGGEQDVARIGLELTSETLFLTKERLSHLDANEWFSKIRRFLRQHGWTPEDERPLPPS